MDRRSFLALLGSAPLAALAPMPHFLPTRMVDPHVGIAIRFIKHWEPMPMRYALWNQPWPVRINSA